MVALGEFDACGDSIIEDYKRLHMYPELGYEETETSKFIAERLRRYGLDVREGLAITGVIGDLDSGRPGKTILLRADMDALEIEERTDCDFSSRVPGRMHACGHDGHVAMLLGAAAYLSAHRETFRGKIRFLFQPAEENSSPKMRREAEARGYRGMGGAGFMIQEGALRGVDACCAIHVTPLYPTGTVFVNKSRAMASSDKFTASVIGTGGHGAMPHKSVDPVAAASAVMDAYNLLPARELSAFEPCVVSVGTIQTPSSTWNALPERVVVTGNVRTFDDGVREYVLGRMEELLAGIAKAWRCSHEFARMKGYGATINDSGMAAFAADVAERLLGPGKAVLSDIPFMTSEDVGNFFSEVPGVLVWLGVSADGKEAPALHSPHFRLDPAALAYGAALHVNLALEYLKG